MGGLHNDSLPADGFFERVGSCLGRRRSGSEQAGVVELRPAGSRERLELQLSPVTRRRSSRGGNMRPWRWMCSPSHSRSGATPPADALVEGGQVGRAAGSRAAPRSGSRGCRSGSSRTGRRPQWTSCSTPSGGVRTWRPSSRPSPRSTPRAASSTAERALDQRQLELEAQDDVEVVGRLVGVDADQRALDRVDRAVERVRVDAAEGAGPRCSRRLGSTQRAERARAADDVLRQPALGLVDAERDGRAQRRAREPGRDAAS